MADPVSTVQRIMFPKTGSGSAEYLDGNGKPYSEQLRRLSWTVATDVPAIGQFSATLELPVLKEVYGLQEGQHYLHPTRYTKYKHTDHLSFSKTNDDLGVGTLGNPKSTVYDRLYVGSKSTAKPKRRVPQGRYELAADVAFVNCTPVDAVPLYTEQIVRSGSVDPNLFAYEKRCAANAELGRYREALEDAQFILNNCGPQDKGSALMRVKAIKDFITKVEAFEPGYHHAATTLVCLLRPREHRQVVASSPSTYGRPNTASTIGVGLSGTASVGSLLAWDKDGDGSIDHDEFLQGIAALGYKGKQQSKAMFRGGQRGVA